MRWTEVQRSYHRGFWDGICAGCLLAGIVPLFVLWITR